IDDIALTVVLDVLPECSRVDVREITGGPQPGADVTFAHRAARGAMGDLDERHAPIPGSVHTLLQAVYRTGAAQTGSVEPGVTAPGGGGPGASWFAAAPIGFGGRGDGVLAAFGPTADLPPNAREVCEVIGDQLALYRHLDHTMTTLRHTMAELKDTGGQ